MFLCALLSIFWSQAIAFAGGRTGVTTGSTRPHICNVPTDGAASPLHGAGSFEQKLLRFEEFGTKPMNPSGGSKVLAKALPPPTGPYGLPPGDKIDEFLLGPLYPYPLRDANQAMPNPWQTAIENFHTGPLTKMPGKSIASFADGRPPGPWFGHQRWQEFAPQVFLETVVTGARVNTGLRDSAQRHQYYFGEFGPGPDHVSGTEDDGLYHSVYAYSGPVHPTSPLASAADPVTGIVDVDLRGTTRGIPVAFHPELPVQDAQSLWTFDGTFPPKILMVRVGESILLRNHNGLPIKFEGNRGFGNHFITTHEHNGHNPGESDGFAQAYFLPGQFYDYRWPMALAGHDSINTDRSDARASLACDPGERVTISVPGVGDSVEKRLGSFQNSTETCPANGRLNISGDYRETMSTHWFHDHMIDYTAQNVYKGNSAMMNYYSGIDRGNECWNDGVNLRLPSGCGQKFSLATDDEENPQQSKRSWGVRDYDVELEIASKAWGQDSSVYPGGELVTGLDALGNPIVEDQLWFAPFNSDGFVGDRMTVNWLYDPYLDVRARRYRLRLLNADVSRFIRVAMVVARDGNGGEFDGEGPGISYDPVPFYMIANDGNIMEHAVPHDGSMDLDGDDDRDDHNGILPTQSIAERYDIVVDFEDYSPGDKIYLVNLLEHTDGRGPEREIPLAAILDGTHDSCDSAVGKFLEIRVHAYEGMDLSLDPSEYVPGKKVMIPLPGISEEEIRGAVNHSFQFGAGGLTDSQPRGISSDLYPTPGGSAFLIAESTPGEGRTMPDILALQPGEDNQLNEMVTSCVNYDLEETDEHMLNLGMDFNSYMNDIPLFSAGEKELRILEFHPPKAWGINTNGALRLATDMHRVSVAPVLGDLEIWHLENESNMWSHNIHIHFEEGRILQRDGRPPPEWEKWARKDVYRLGNMDDSSSSIDIALRFREFAGSYMSHCHNTTHEDHAMLLRWDIERPGQLKTFLTPEPQWNGTSYSESHEQPRATQRSPVRGDDLAKRNFDQNDIGAMLCATETSSGCPGAIQESVVEEASRDLCDANDDGQIDIRDFIAILRAPPMPGASSPLVQWASCSAKCTHRGCSPHPGRRCGLLGAEVLLVLLPLALRRRRRIGQA